MTARPDLIVAGAGMAGLVAAAQARELGAEVRLHEREERVGGSMRLSSGWVWRHRDFEDFRRECPGGDERLQRLVFERLDDDLAWLESLGADPISRDTGNPRTAGARFDPPRLAEALLAAAGATPLLAEPLVEIPAEAPVVLATGGFPADRALVREWVTPEADHLMLRAAPGGVGDGLRLGLAAGGTTSEGMDETYGRNMPAPPAAPGETEYVPAAQLYARYATVTNVDGERYEARTWSEVDVFQWTARQPGARAWFAVTDDALAERVRERPVGEMVEAARRAGAPVRRDDGGWLVETVAGITTTLGGLRVDESACVAPGVHAAGNDVGGVATGGYASGLAAALVLGRIAAAAALESG